MSPSSVQIADIVIRNDVAELATLRSELESISAKFGVPEKSLIQLQIALDEIASNVIKYGWYDGGNHELCIRITGRRDRIEVEIVDDGRAFDPRQAPTPARALPGARRRPGGVGLHMVKQLVDNLEYERIGGRNRTLITKRYARRRAPDRRTLL
jgi:serine/threonine-protein kinase RsbW